MDELTQKVFKRLGAEFVENNLKEIPPQVQQNIESLLTYLSTDFPWKTEDTKHAHLALYSSIVRVLSDIFTELAKEDLGKYPQLPWRSCDSFARTLRRNAKDISIITLNYDLLLEQLIRSDYTLETKGIELPSCSLFYPYPMAWLEDRTHSKNFGYTSYDTPPTFPNILKLHGSANWFWAGVSPSDVLYFCNWDKNEKDNATTGLKPYIIPPVLDKNAFYNHIAIRSLWQQAEELLKKADEIYIIGFSFPQTDLAVKYLFQSALRGRNPKIYVVNTAILMDIEPQYDAVFGVSKLNYDYTAKPDVVECFIKDIVLTEGHKWVNTWKTVALRG